MRFADCSFKTNPGNPIHVLYSPKVSSDGSIELVPSGKENTDDIIQSHAASTDIKYILSRVSQGDFSALNVHVGRYGDFTKSVGNLAEALQLEIDSKKLFYSLPLDVREKFDFDPNKFFAQSGTKEWYSKLDGVLPDTFKASMPDIFEKKPVVPNGDENEGGFDGNDGKDGDTK